MVEDLFEDEKVKEKNGELPEEDNDDDTPDSMSEDADEDDAWIPLDKEDLDMTLASDEEPEESPEDDAINYEEIGNAYADEKDAAPLKDLVTETIGESEDDPGSGAESEMPAQGGNIDDFSADEEAEAPPWDEIVEIPDHGVASAPIKTKVVMIIAIIAFAAFAFFGLYSFFQYKQMSVKQVVELDENQSKYASNMKDKIRFRNDDQENISEKQSAPMDTTTKKVNSAPIISGNPATTVTEGSKYSFIPKTIEEDQGDKLTFFITNQPAWATFDLTNGALTGTPGSNDVGTYKNIVILVSDGAATTALPEFNITVIGHPLETAQAQETKQPELPVEVPVAEEKDPLQTPPVKEEMYQKADSDMYTPPDLRDLIKQSEFQNAAYEYYQAVKLVPQAYTLKLEVDCAQESIRVAYEKGNFDRRMFILERKVNGRDCFVVFWGLFATNAEALSALPSIPDFFAQQKTKPRLVRLEKYL